MSIKTAGKLKARMLLRLRAKQLKLKQLSGRGLTVHGEMTSVPTVVVTRRFSFSERRAARARVSALLSTPAMSPEALRERIAMGANWESEHGAVSAFAGTRR